MQASCCHVFAANPSHVCSTTTYQCLQCWSPGRTSVPQSLPPQISFCAGPQESSTDLIEPAAAPEGCVDEGKAICRSRQYPTIPEPCRRRPMFPGASDRGSTCWHAEAERTCGRAPDTAASSSSGSSGMLLRIAVFCGVGTPSASSPGTMAPACQFLAQPTFSLLVMPDVKNNLAGITSHKLYAGAGVHSGH